MLVGVTDLFSLSVHTDTDDMNVGIMGIGMFVGYVRLIPIAHLLHIPFRQLYQLPISQPVFRCRRKGDMQDGLLRIAVCQQVVLKREQCQTYVLTGQSQSVGNHAVARKNLGGTCRYLVVVIGKCSVKACSVTYFCNHFRSYSWVSTMTFLQTSISSMLSFSNL